MKRFSIFCAALFAAATSFAAVTYELNGGVTNDYGWTTKAEIALDLQTDYNAAYGTSKAWAKDSLGVVYFCVNNVWVTEEAAKGSSADAGGFLQAVTYNTTDNLLKIVEQTHVDKYGWLKEVIEINRANQSLTGAISEALYRKELSAFFLCSPAHTSWPASSSFQTTGDLSAFQPIWKHSLDNPTNPTAEWVLNAPYKEGSTFAGWYAAADFSGDKVTVINAETTGTLYAKWVEYIPTVAEVKAMADDTETKVAGVVNFISGKNVYIQDATAGILVFTTETPSCKVGDKIVAKGVKVIYGGAPEVKNAVIESVEAASVAAPTVFETLAPLLADSLEFKYYATNVAISGVTIVALDSYNNPTVQDALGNQALCYKMSVDPAAFPVGTKVTVTAVAGWYNGFQFVGPSEGIVRPIVGKKENYTYPTRANGRYSLENNWVISNQEDNFAANKPGSNDYVRGMAAKDGKMYFINRETESIVVVDGKTGDMLEPIKLTGDHLFQKVTGTDSITGEKTYAAGTTLPFNDIKFDAAGNCLIGACMTGATACQTFFIYIVDLETGACTKLIEDVLWENPGLENVQFRFDAFGAAGDVTKNGVVMAADANGSWNVYRWLITDGVAGEGEQVAVLLDPAVDQSLFISAAGYGTAPQIFPQDEEGSLFYVDGFNTLPMLFYGNPEEGATLIDDFINVPSGTKVWNNPGDTISMNTGFNGLVEFQVGDDYFLLMIAMNNVGSVPTTYALYKFADEDRMFEGMEPLWYFPAKGLGTATIGCRTATPSVDVVSDTEATLYLYATNNGYAAYTLTIDPTKTAVEDVEAVKVTVEKVIENGQIFILKNGVKYNALGAQVK